MLPTTVKTACLASVAKTISIPQCYFYAWWLEDEDAIAEVDGVSVTAPVIFDSTTAYSREKIEPHDISITSSTNTNIILEYWS